jgi:predicted CxxxxCH...CXXCH cytochrome family protein
MKRTFAVTWALALLAIILPVTAGAVPPPSHFGLAVGMNCDTCHQEHRTLGKTNYQGPINRPSPAPFNNMCQSCHRTGDGFAKAKPMALVDTSAIFGDHSTANFGKLRQTSHRWDGTDYLPAAGAQPPVQAAMTTNTNNVGNIRGRLGSELACARCHSPHLGGAPGAMLRLGKENDQLCRDCHRSRDTEALALAAGGIPNNSKFGTHPIGVNYDTAFAKGNFAANPINANPANPTSNLGNYLTKGGALGSANFPVKAPLDPTTSIPNRNVICSTCHGIHYTDSRSSTFDGASTAKGKGNYANLSTGDGYQLRTDKRGKKVLAGQTDNLNICTNCHTNKKSHNGRDQDVQCIDCHGAHVEYDATNSSVINPLNLPNVHLVRRNVTEGKMPTKIFFRYTGSKREYVNSSGTGACQGCHVVPGAGGKYPAEHDSPLASDCNKCHFHSSTAGSFSGSCGMCHGDPPTIATPGAGGLASPPTGALGGSFAGAHAAHVLNGRRMECNTCHSGYTNRTMPNSTIDIGFDINGSNVPGFPYVSTTGTTYYNTNTLLNGYTFTGSVMTTGGSNQTCSAVYCHGATLTGGSNSTPSWIGGATQAQCGTCHGTSSASPPTAGSHTRHAGAGAGQLQIPCASCHGAVSNASHVNGNVKWNLAGLSGGQYKTPSGRFYTISGSTGRTAPSAAYGTCQNIYCHSNAAANGSAFVYSTVTWGGAALNCGSCHNNMATTASANGGHFKHSSTGNAGGPAYDCSTCHAGYTATVANGATHANKTVELMAVGYSKASPMPAGVAWGTCSTNVCHGQATALSWNNGTIWQSGGDRCSTCHSSAAAGAVTAGVPFYSTEYPVKQTLKTNAKVGAHTYHVASISLMSTSLVCADCHGPVALKDANHMNGVTNFVWNKFANHSGATNPAYSTTTRQCTNVYCHGNGLQYGDATGTNRSPTWNVPFMPATLTLPASCNSCHGFPPSAATGHPVVAASLATCKTCHDNVNASATGYADVFISKSLHINGVLEGGGCNGCHGYPPSRKSFTGSAGNWADARMENYSNAGGAHTVAAHVPPTATQGQAWSNCITCHNPADHAPSPVLFLPSTNIKVSIDNKLKFNVAMQPRYGMYTTSGAKHKPGTCGNVSCHYQKTPKWN